MIGFSFSISVLILLYFPESDEVPSNHEMPQTLNMLQKKDMEEMS